MTKPAELPLELKQATESPIAWQRGGAVHGLESLLRGSDQGLALAAREQLQKLMDDDSRQVSTAAARSLAAYEQPVQEGLERGKAEAEADRAAGEKAAQERLAREKAVRLAREKAEVERVEREKDERKQKEQLLAGKQEISKRPSRWQWALALLVLVPVTIYVIYAMVNGTGGSETIYRAPSFTGGREPGLYLTREGYEGDLFTESMVMEVPGIPSVDRPHSFDQIGGEPCLERAVPTTRPLEWLDIGSCQP